jgi:hypothetical protein
MKHDTELPNLSDIEQKIFEETIPSRSKNIKIGKSKGKRVTILAATNEILTTISQPIPIVDDIKPQSTKIMIKIPKGKK